jgi:uncharacterized membrane protein YjdF
MSRHPERAELLLGDWNRWVRDPIDVLRATFLAGAGLFALLGEAGAAVRMALTFALVVVARLVSLPRPFDLGFIVGMALQAWGNALNLFNDWPWWDVVVHFVLPFFSAPTLYILLARLEVVPDLDEDTEAHHYLGILLVTFCLGLSVGAIYEMYEWFDTRVFGGGLHVGYGDTIADLFDDALASLGGGALLVWWATRGWGTTRRVPGRRLDERLSGR